MLEITPFLFSFDQRKGKKSKGSAAVIESHYSESASFSKDCLDFDDWLTGWLTDKLTN